MKIKVTYIPNAWKVGFWGKVSKLVYVTYNSESDWEQIEGESGE